MPTSGHRSSVAAKPAVRHGPAYRLDRLRGGVAGVADRRALDEPAHSIQIDHVGIGQAADEDPSVELGHGQPLVHQQPEGFAKGVAGDPEGRADGVLGQPGAGGERAVDDPLPDDVGYPLRGAAAGQPPAVGGEDGEDIGRCPGHEINNNTKVNYCRIVQHGSKWIAKLLEHGPVRLCLLHPRRSGNFEQQSLQNTGRVTTTRTRRPGQDLLGHHQLMRHGASADRHGCSSASASRRRHTTPASRAADSRMSARSRGCVSIGECARVQLDGLDAEACARRAPLPVGQDRRVERADDVRARAGERQPGIVDARLRPQPACQRRLLGRVLKLACRVGGVGVVRPPELVARARVAEAGHEGIVDRDAQTSAHR